MRLLYNLGILLYGLAVRIAALAHPKARLWVQGRRDWRGRLRKAMHGQEGTWVWIHCASLGEFEQGRSLIETIRVRHPHLKVLLSFYSPSGYEIRKGYAQAHHVCYLPLDTPANARDFLAIVRPRLAIFVKYDLWLNMLDAAFLRQVPVVLVSAILRPESRFLRSRLRGSYRTAFARMAAIFTQDAESVARLQEFCGSERIYHAGDTRFDRAVQLPAQFQPVEGIAEFVAGHLCLVAGSPWPKDEAILLPALAALADLDIRCIIAPHEIHPAHIDRHIADSQGRMAKYSQRAELHEGTRVLWIDNVGMLSRLYHYADVVYIGGGFGAGIHNTQEPAVYGCPVVFGPRYDKFQEAVDMLAAGGAASVADTAQLAGVLRRWLADKPLRERLRAQNAAYMQAQAGATARILSRLDAEGMFSA
jgi:3-deoxy-D-manno-octulosonic-acid transferase